MLASLQSLLPRLPFYFINRNASCPWTHRPCAQLKKCTCGHNQFSLMALCVSNNNGKWRLNSYWKLSNEKRVIRIVALERGKDCRSVGHSMDDMHLFFRPKVLIDQMIRLHWMMMTLSDPQSLMGRNIHYISIAVGFIRSAGDDVSWLRKVVLRCGCGTCLGRSALV